MGARIPPARTMLGVGHVVIGTVWTTEIGRVSASVTIVAVPVLRAAERRREVEVEREEEEPQHRQQGRDPEDAGARKRRRVRGQERGRREEERRKITGATGEVGAVVVFRRDNGEARNDLPVYSY